MHPLKLILINGKINESSNYPLEIWALDKDNQKSIYYAKPFRKIGLNAFPTAKEILGCEMALIFDLPTPRYNIINIDDTKLSSYYSENEIRKFHKGYKFCSKKLDQYAGFNPHVSIGFLREYEIAGIFAFDVLMQNADRGGFRGKPNLMINDDNLIMIDHELTLSFINDKQTKPDYENNIRIYPYYNHVLINHLKAIKEKSHIFDEFFEHLNRFNINNLNSIFDEMDKFNIEYGDRLDYFLYFDWFKKNRDIIKNYLLAMIQ
jgi:hypothetical protein